MTTPRPLVVDTDPGVDDALALVLALRSPELRVELVTTVAGNVPIGAVTDNARRLLALLAGEASPRLVRGAARPLSGRLATAAHVHGEDGLAGLSHLRDGRGAPLYPSAAGPRPGRDAAAAIVASAREHGEALTLVALGPLTNVARALDLDAAAMRGIGRVIVMGGAIAVPGNITAGAEFNFHVDPLAADRVLASGMRVTLVPLDVTRQVRLRWPAVRRALAGRRSLLARALRHVTRELAARREGLVLHDPLAMALAIDPALVASRALPVRVETAGAHARGMSIADRRGLPRGAVPAPTVDVALEVDAGQVLDLVSERVLTRGREARVAPARAADVVVVGSANTDYSVTGPALPRPGETVTDGTLHRGFGGKGANQAVAARRAGARVALAARLGDDEDGERYLAHLRAEGIDTAAVARDRRAASGVALIAVDTHGRNQIAVAPGANARLRPAHLPPAMRQVRAGGVVVAQLEVPLDTVEAAFRAARRAAARTLLNPAPYRPLPQTLVALTDVVVANEVEAAELAGQPVRNVTSARRAAAALVARGFATALVTLGARGVAWHHGTKGGHVRAPEVEAVDTTGAGDSFVGSLAAGLARGEGLVACIEAAVQAAARAVTRAGAQGAGLRRARRSPADSA